MKITPTQTALGGNNNWRNKKWCGGKQEPVWRQPVRRPAVEIWKRNGEAASKARCGGMIPIGLLTKYPWFVYILSIDQLFIVSYHMRGGVKPLQRHSYLKIVSN